MTPDTPEPEQPERTAPSPDAGPDPRIPRVLVSVDDLENPGDWDVIVVEDPTVDDQTARNIARARAGKKVTLPSLDERDVIRAFDTDRDAEDLEGLSVDAFGPPDDAPAPRRPARATLPPEAPAEEDPFAGLPEPEPEAEPEATPPPEPGPVAEVPAWSPRDLAPMDAAVSQHRPSAAELAASLHDYPAAADEPADVDEPIVPDDAPRIPAFGVGVADAPASETEAESVTDAEAEPIAESVTDTEPEPAPVEEAPAASDAADATSATAEAAPEVIDHEADGAVPETVDAPAGHTGTALLDDPDDDFYGIGDAALSTSELEAAAEAEAGDDAADDVSPDAERELLDDPDDAFCALGAHAEAMQAHVDAADVDPPDDVPSDDSGTPDDDASDQADSPEAKASDATDTTPSITGRPAAPVVLPSTERLSPSLWGSPGDAAPAAPAAIPVIGGPTVATPAPAFAGPPPKPAPEPEEEETFEDELEFDSSFPLGPDDVLVAGEALPIALDTLDYASVFGPVEGTLEAPEIAPPAPRAPRRPKPLYYQPDAGAEDELDEDEDDLWPVAPVRSGGRKRRRRELVVLGVAAGAIAAIGIGTQVFGGAKSPTASVGPTTTTTIGARVTVPAGTGSTLISPTTIDPALIFGTDGGAQGATPTTVRKRTSVTTTTVHRTTPSTPGPTTTVAPAPTTTAPPATTTTTAPPATTTTVDTGTTGGL